MHNTPQILYALSLAISVSVYVVLMVNIWMHPYAEIPSKLKIAGLISLVLIPVILYNIYKVLKMGMIY